MKTHISDHEKHNQSCQGHNDTRDWSPGRGKCEWLATIQILSVSNSTDSIMRQMLLVCVVSVLAEVEYSSEK